MKQEIQKAMIFSLQLQKPALFLFPNSEQGQLGVRQIITGNISEINMYDIYLSSVVQREFF